MRKGRFFRLGIVLVCLLVGVVWIVPALAQEDTITETFDEPPQEGWEYPPEGVVVDDGVLHIEREGFAFRFGNWQDLTLTVQALRLGEGVLVVHYRASDSGDYAVLLGPDFVELHRGGGGAEPVVLGHAPVELPEGVWIDVGVGLSGENHEITLGGETVLSATDAADLPPGAVGFRVMGEAIGEFDNLTVTGAGASPMPEEPAEGAPIPELFTEGAEGMAFGALPWVRLGGPIGGLGYDIRYNYDNHDIWYVTDAWAGIHMSTDRGLTWFPTNEGLSGRFGPAGDAIPIFSVTVDQLDPNIVWIGTQNSGHIYRSADGGYTWEQRDNGVDHNLVPLSFRGFTVHPESSDIVYAMAEIGSPGWTPDHTQRVGLELDLTMGIVYRTEDGGLNWEEVWRGNNLARYCWINPDNLDIIYISTGIFDREAADIDIEANYAGGVGILRSTDGGDTWETLDQDNGLTDRYVGSLYMHPENPDILLAAACQNNWSGFFGGGEFTGGVFLTEDGGDTWERVIDERELHGAVEYCPSDPNIAYVASTGSVYRSEDAGHTWTQYNRGDGTWGSPGVIAGFPIDIQCDPDNPDRLFVNNYLGGNFLSEDGGQTWVSASQGYTGALVHHLAVAPGQPQTVYAGSRTGVFRSDDGGHTWRGISYVIDVDSMEPGTGEVVHTYPAVMAEITSLALDPADPNHVLASAADGSTVAHTTDGGSTWRGIRMMGGPPSSLVFAPSDPATVYATVGCGVRAAGSTEPNCDQPGSGIYVSHDSGYTWDAPGGERTTGVSMTALAVHPTDPNILYAGTPASGVITSADGGETWSATGSLPPHFVHAIAIDPTNPNIIFVGLEGASIHRSTDGGASWVQVSAGLDSDGTVSSIVFDPNDSQIVYIADRFTGVDISFDGGDTWQAFNEGLDHRTGNTLAISDDGSVLYLAIEGAGVYRLGTPPSIPAPPEAGEAPAEAEPAAEEAAPAVEEEGGGGLCPSSYAPLAVIPFALGLAFCRGREKPHEHP